MSDSNPNDKTPAELPGESKPRARMTPVRWVIAIVFVVALVILYYGLLDRYTPITSDCFVQTYVTRIAPQVAGRVTAVHVQNNKAVKAGQILFELDARPYSFAVNQLEAELALATKEVALMKQDLDLANETIDQANTDLELMRKEYKEYSRAAERAATAKLVVYQAQARLREQEATLQQTLAKRAKVEQSLAARVGDRNALVAKAQASLDEANYQLEQTKIVAPTDGYVTNLQLSVGTYVDAGAPALSVVDSGNWWIVGNFPENSLALLRPGQPARAALGLVPGRIFKAEVESVGWGVGQGQGVPSGDLPDVTGPSDWVKTTQRFPVRFRLKDPEPAGNLRVGGTVTVLVLPTGNVPLNALGWLWLKIASLLNFLS